MPRKGKPRSRRRVILSYTGIAAALILVAGIVFARVRLNGAPLGRRVASMLNRRVRGRIHIGSIEWPLSGLYKAAVGGWIPVTVRDIAVYDAAGRKVVSTKLATAEIDAHPLLFDGDFVFRNVVIPRGGHVLIKQVPTRHPADEYDTRVISLVSAFYPPRKPSFQFGKSAQPKPIFDLRHIEARGVTVDLDYPQFSARLAGVHTSGFLYYNGHDPLTAPFYYSLAPHAARATVTTQGITLHLRDVVMDRLAQLPEHWPRSVRPSRLAWHLSAHVRDGGQMTSTGSIYPGASQVFGGAYDVHLAVTGAGSLAGRISHGVAGGKALRAALEVSGPRLAPRLGASVSGLTLAVPLGRRPAAGKSRRPPLRLSVASAGVTLDTATDRGTIANTVAEGVGGRIALGGGFGLHPARMDVGVKVLRPLDLAAFLPHKLAKALGTRLSGHLRVSGGIDRQRLDDLDLHLGRAHITGSATSTKGGAVHTDGLSIRVGKTSIRAHSGTVDLVRKVISGLRLSVHSRDLALWLRRLGAPAVARSLDSQVRVWGPLTSPQASGRVDVGGIPVVGRAHAKLGYRDHVVALRSVSASPLSGSLAATGRIRVGSSSRILSLHATASHLDLSKLPLVGPVLSGRGSMKLSARGRFDRPDATATATASNLRIDGDRYPRLSVSARSRADGSRSLALHLRRQIGGALDATATLSAGGDLGGNVTLAALPLQSLVSLGSRRARQGSSPIGGTASAGLALSGTLSAPTASGHLSLIGAWLRSAFLGAADLRIDRVGDGLIRIRGQLFQGMIRIDATLATTSPFEVHCKVAVKRLEFDRFLPKLAERYGARGWITGHADFTTTLVPVAGRSPRGQVDLTEAVLLLDNEDPSGRPAPIRVETRTPLQVAFEGGHGRLLSDVILHDPAGNFRVSGSGGVNGLHLKVSGSISAALLEPYLRDYFDRLGGAADVKVAITGPITKPHCAGVVDFEKIVLKPTGQDAVVRIPAGKIQFTNDQLSVTGLSMVVVDQYSHERAQLSIAGGVKLKDFQPQIWALRVDGHLGGKMLLVLAPRVFSSASGDARLSLALLGVGRTPDIDGTLDFHTKKPLEFSPRGLRRDIVLNRGTVKFTDQLIEVSHAGGWVDEEGRIQDVSGEISLKNWKPVDIDLVASADELPFRVPQTLDLTLGLRNFRVVGDFSQGLEIAGTVNIIDGRYFHQFNPILDALKPTRTVETTTPFYKQVPILANAHLALSVQTRSFRVKNNVANIELTGGVNIGGTPAHPRFDGVVRVDQGSFKFQGIRAKFQRTTGTITFDRLRQFPTDTPTLDLHSESDYRDSTGQDHLITLQLTGPVSRLRWDLHTQSGLNKAQTLTLIVSGRTPEQVRTKLGDEPIGASPGEFTNRSTLQSTGTLSAADQLVKDLAGDYISLLVGNSIRNITDLDVFRLEVTPESIGAHAEKRFTKSTRLIGDLEQSLRGRSLDVRGEYRILDRLSVQGEYLNKTYNDQAAEQNVSSWRVKAAWRWLIP